MESVFTGIVTDGNKLGRTIGFPTANIAISEGTAVTDGVYAAIVRVGGKSYGALVNIGRKPTVGSGNSRMLEAHLLDFSGDIYGQAISVRLVKFIRPERKFASVEELRRQINKDKEEILKHIKL